MDPQAITDLTVSHAAQDVKPVSPYLVDGSTV